MSIIIIMMMIGKATSLKVFFQHVEYICVGNNPVFLNYTSTKSI